MHGGIEAFVLALADWLRTNTRHQVRVCFKLVAGSAPSQQLEADCRDLELDYHFVGRGSIALLRNVRWSDVVHGNNCSPDITFAARLLGRPLVLTVHNWFRNGSGLRDRVWLLCNRLAARRLYNSTFVWKTWEPGHALRGSGLMPTVSHLPQEETPFDQRRGFCFVARLIANKGLETLVAAHERARIDKDAWPLRIAGDGPLRPWLEARLRQGASPGISCLGFIAEAQKHRLIAGSRWLVAPANTREDMGLTPIEARNVAVPSIVTRDGGLPESAGDAALLCDPGNVAQLALLLEQAAGMPEQEYRTRALHARDSLRTYLRPLSDYCSIYEAIAPRAGRAS